MAKKFTTAKIEMTGTVAAGTTGTVEVEFPSKYEGVTGFTVIESTGDNYFQIQIKDGSGRNLMDYINQQMFESDRNVAFQDRFIDLGLLSSVNRWRVNWKALKEIPNATNALTEVIFRMEE